MTALLTYSPNPCALILCYSLEMIDSLSKQFKYVAVVKRLGFVDFCIPRYARTSLALTLRFGLWVIPAAMYAYA